MPGEIAKAYVQIVPSAEGIKSKLNEQLGGEASAAGESFGKKMLGKIKGVIAAAGIGKALAASINEGGALQQSLGGVETLFGDHADAVIANANKAYKTAGLSANTYMEQVTSFSASLLHSLGNNTEAAADVADMALRDMSDNANKFGTDMESIQNAYQGFAKQNYTMLDNLKLGYGGTKTEMERLLKDAQAISGVKYDISHLDDVYEAIHVIQEDMGVTGTTAKEASETISGSFAAMKASFSNVLGNLALGEDIGPSLDALFDTTQIFLMDNFLPMVGNVLAGVPEIVATLAGSIANEFLGVFGTDLETVANELSAKFEPARAALDELVGTVSNIVSPIIDSFSEYIDSGAAMEDATEGISDVLDTMTSALTTVLTAANDFLTWLSEGSTSAQIFIAVMSTCATALALWKGLQTATSLVQKLRTSFTALNGVMKANMFGIVVTALAAVASYIIYVWNTNEDFRNAVTEIWSDISTAFETAIGTISGWLDGLSTFVGDTLSNIGEFFGDMEKNTTQKFEQMKESASTSAEKLRSTVSTKFAKAKESISTTCTEAKKAVSDKFSQMKNSASEISDNIRTTVSDKFSQVKESMGDAMQQAKENISSKLDSIKQAYDSHGGGINGIVAGAMEGVQQTYSSGYNIVDTLTGGKLSDVAAKFRTYMGNASSAVSEKIGDVKSFFTDGLANAYQTVSGKLSNIKNKFSSIMEGAKEVVKGAIDKIKGFFDFEWSLPKIKIPEIVVTGLFSLVPLRVPKFDVIWNKQGGILSGATIFGELGGKLLGGGEAGMEAVLPLSQFYSRLESILSKQNGNTATGGFHQELHFHGPKNPTASEAARKTRNATKELVLALNRR